MTHNQKITIQYMESVGGVLLYNNVRREWMTVSDIENDPDLADEYQRTKDELWWRGKRIGKIFG